jgi:hypothetical protein
MPVINNPNRPNVPPTTTTGAQGTTPASNAGNAASTSTTTVDPAVQSAAGQIVNAQKVTINGLAGGQMTASGTTSRFARDTSFDTYSATGAGPVSRGFIRTDAQPIPGG